jgi:LPS-assembly protein
MHAAARLALVFTLGLPGLLPAAESLPPLRVDPALLGGVRKPAPERAPEPAAPPPQTPPLQAQPVVREEPVRVVQPETTPAKPAAISAEKKAEKGAEKEASRPREVAPAKPAAFAAEKPDTRAGVSPPKPAPATAVAKPAPVERKTEVADVPIQPPQVAEQPALPPLYSAHAEAGLLPALRSAEGLSAHDVDKNAPYPTFIAASRIDGRNDNEIVAEGDAELRKTNTSLTADRLTYWKAEDELEAAGNVRYSKDAERISGPKMRLNMTDNTGFFEQPEYSITRPARVDKRINSMLLVEGGAATGKKMPSFLQREKADKPVVTVVAGEVVEGEHKLTTASGRASQIEFLGENRMRLTNATYTTCTADDPAWYAKAAELNLDYDREVGEARDAQVVFQDTTLFYSPWLSFSLNNKRKSGFLASTTGVSSKSGLEFTLPYYWDIAPNMDLTVAPRLMTKRGLQINSDFRYLNHDYRGLAQVEWVPNDSLEDRKRYGYSLLHTHNNLGYGFSGLLNINGVSDGTYFRDLSTRISQSAQGNLLRQGLLTYGGGWWSATANLQYYQTLQDPANPINKPYERKPQLTLVANRPEFLGGTAFAFNGEWVNFDHPTLDTAKRLSFYPRLSLPLLGAAWHITPKIGLHFSRYDIDRRTSTGPDTVVRNLPVFSLDAGVAFEREFSWFGKSLAQTLEPRLYYLLIPQRTQNNIPIFDTAQSDFNFATIFSDNIYSGIDRIADANTITAALTSRLIDPGTGEEYVRGMVGQRYYFAQQNVTLPGEPARPGGAYDFLAALSGRLMPKTYADVAWQYNPRDGETERFVVGGRWQPEVAKVLNASYRYTRDHSFTGGTAGIKQVDFSGQWPLGRGWYGVGRFNYSLRDSRLIETIAGLEYNGGCWVGRGVLQRYATSSGDTNTAFFVQLELNDFSSIGSNPLQMLARRIPGYGRINRLASDPVFGYE